MRERAGAAGLASSGAWATRWRSSRASKRRLPALADWIAACCRCLRTRLRSDRAGAGRERRYALAGESGALWIALALAGRGGRPPRGAGAGWRRPRTVPASRWSPTTVVKRVVRARATADLRACEPFGRVPASPLVPVRAMPRRRSRARTAIACAGPAGARGAAGGRGPDGLHTALPRRALPLRRGGGRRSRPAGGMGHGGRLVKVGHRRAAERRQVDALQRAHAGRRRRRPSIRSRPSSRTWRWCRCPTSASSASATRSASSGACPSRSSSSTSPGSCAARTRARASATASSATSATSTRSLHVVRAFEHPQVAHPHGEIDPGSRPRDRRGGAAARRPRRAPSAGSRARRRRRAGATRRRSPRGRALARGRASCRAGRAGAARGRPADFEAGPGGRERGRGGRDAGRAGGARRGRGLRARRGGAGRARAGGGGRRCAPSSGSRSGALDADRARRLRPARPDHVLHRRRRAPRSAHAACARGARRTRRPAASTPTCRRGFVRAEVIGWQELVEAGSFAARPRRRQAAHRGPRLRRRRRRRADDQVHAVARAVWRRRRPQAAVTPFRGAIQLKSVSPRQGNEVQSTAGAPCGS